MGAANRAEVVAARPLRVRSLTLRLLGLSRRHPVAHLGLSEDVPGLVRVVAQLAAEALTTVRMGRTSPLFSDPQTLGSSRS